MCRTLSVQLLASQVSPCYTLLVITRMSEAPFLTHFISIMELYKPISMGPWNITGQLPVFMCGGKAKSRQPAWVTTGGLPTGNT